MKIGAKINKLAHNIKPADMKCPPEVKITLFFYLKLAYATHEKNGARRLLHNHEGKRTVENK